MSESIRWSKTRQKLLRQIKAQVSELLGESGDGLESYGKYYHQEFEGVPWRPSRLQNVITSMIQTQLVLGADFHAYSQSQRTHLRILRSLPPGLKVTVALECFESEDQPLLDEYVHGHLAEKIFLRDILWDEKWGFPWEHYRPLVQLARQKGFKVKGLNKYFTERSIETLSQRDLYSANIIWGIRQENPEDIIYCLYGDLHLASEHLPKALKHRFQNPNLLITSIFQDNEKLYFDLAQRGLESQVEFMAREEDTFCIIGSPPWVKWQSYLIYLEHTFDRDLEEDDDEGGFDFTDHIHAIVQVLSAELKLEVDVSELAVYTASDDIPITEEELGKGKLSLIEGMIASEKNFYLAEKSILYLSRFSANHAAALAGMFVHFQLMGLYRLPLNFPEDFTRYIWLEAISFFFSKWINHKRKADSLRELKARFSANEDDFGVEKEPMLLALDQRLVDMLKVVNKQGRELKVVPENNMSYIEASKILGSMLGEKIYFAYKEEKLTLEELQKILSFNISGEGFQSFYLSQVQRFESLGSSRGLS